jgi:hypothetical protein
VPLVVSLAMIVLFAVLEWARAGGPAPGRSAALRFLGGELGRDACAAVAGAPLALSHPQARGKTSRTKTDAREHGFIGFYLRYNKLFGLILIVLAVGFPFHALSPTGAWSMWPPWC